MKNNFFLLGVLLVYIQTYSQISFEKGYFIDNNSVRNECFIKNEGTYLNPSTFEYKLAYDAKVNIGDIKDIQEFGIVGTIKYERNRVDIDVSSSNLNKLSEKKEPEWKSATVFLRVLIEGNPTLFEYVDGDLKRYFYKWNNTLAEQLVYKKYYIYNLDDINNSSLTKLAVNKEYQRQLWSNLRCETTSMDDVMHIEYRQKDLSNYFIELNKCKNYSYTDYRGKLKSTFNLSLKAGFNASTLDIPSESGSYRINFGTKMNFKMGGELEYVFPINRNKWALYFEPSYQSYKTETVVKVPNNSGVLFADDFRYKWEVSHKYIDLALGLRHYLFFNDNSKLFVNCAYTISPALNSTIKKENNLYYDLHTRMGFSYGLGYNYKGKYSIEFRASSNSADKYYSYSQYDTLSMILGYSIFNNKP